MPDGQTTLAIIVARGGSKGLPHKNILPCAGRPLIAWSIDAARAAVTVDDVVVSTDDADIAEVARAAGVDVPWLRPAALATDEATVAEVVVHALSQQKAMPTGLVLLQATSPLRTGADVDACVAALSTAPSCVSLCAVSEHPAWMMRLAHDGRLSPLLGELPSGRRQQLEPLHVLNGAVYAARVDWFLRERRFIGAETTGYVMPVERSVDVDTALDLLLCDAILRSR